MTKSIDNNMEEHNQKPCIRKRPKPFCFKSYLQKVKIIAIFCVICLPIESATFIWLYFQFDDMPFSREWRVIQKGMLSLAICFGLYTIIFTILLIGVLRKIKWILHMSVVFLALAILFLIGFMIGFFGFGIHYETGQLIGWILSGLFGVCIAFGAMRDIHKAIKEIEYSHLMV